MIRRGFAGAVCAGLLLAAVDGRGNGAVAAPLAADAAVVQATAPARSDPATAPAPAPVPVPVPVPGDLGRQVYNARCYFCHGYSGDARTQAAALMRPAPRDFTRAPALDAAQVRAVLAQGRPGTAMASFADVLSAGEIAAVADFVVAEFVRARAPNSAYHTAENGWPDHQRYAAAFDFATGRLRGDAADLDAQQRRGLALYLSACVSCHDAGDATPLHWAPRPASYPRPGIGVGGVPLLDPPLSSGTAGGAAFAAAGPTRASPGVDAVAGASVYARHERPPRLKGLTPRERRGERLYQANCAFCHAPDGSGRNWIGQFMEPPARDLRQLDGAALARLPATLRDGLPGRSMPAWRDVLTAPDIAAVAAYVKKAFARTGPSR